MAPSEFDENSRSALWASGPTSTMLMRPELIQWFRANAPSLADAYEGAIRMIEDVTFPGRTHFISHAVRDIANRLAEALNPALEGARIGYEDALDRVAPLWQSVDSFDPDDSAIPSETVRIPYGVAKQLDVLVRRHAERRKRPSHYRMLFDELAKRDPACVGVSERVVEEFGQMRQWFMEHTHLRNKSSSGSNLELEDQFAIFERMLHSFMRGFYGGIHEIDTLLNQLAHEESPSQIEEALRQLGPMLAYPLYENHFFERIDTPGWISPLASRGYFRYPLPVQRHPDGSYSYGPWQPSKFLVRVATKAPKEVAQIFADMSTDNYFVLSDMLDAALIMQSDNIVTMLQSIQQSLGQCSFPRHDQKVADLCLKLLDDGRVKESMRLADAYFSPNAASGDIYHDRRGDHDYLDNFARVAPQLAVARPKFLRSLCGWLTYAIKARENVSTAQGYDFSTIWRPAIEEHPDNSIHDFAGMLSGIVCTSFENAITDNALSLPDAAEILNRNTYSIFGRMRVHLARRFAEKYSAFAVATVLDQDLLQKHDCMHEYGLLVKSSFHQLTEEQRQEWFGWIDLGPRLSAKEKAYLTDESAEDRADRERFARSWRLSRLRWVRDHLSGERLTQYQKLLAEFGEPEERTSKWSSFRMGNESPIAESDLEGMSFAAVVDTVTNWTPPASEWGGPSQEGLADVFGIYVSKNAADYSQHAPLLENKPSIFIRTFVSKMEEAVKTKNSIDVRRVVQLCQWVVVQPYDPLADERSGERPFKDRWQWLRDEVARLVKAICQSRTEAERTYSVEEYRDSIWTIVLALGDAPTGSNILRDTSILDPRLQDYTDLAINSSQGKALEAALAYAQWVAGHAVDAKESRPSYPNGLDEIPEVRSYLEETICSADRTVESMATVGLHLWLLHWIDPEWLATNAQSIFAFRQDTPASENATGWAAWNAFLLWHRPHIDFYIALRSQYAFAVQQSGLEMPPERGHQNPMNDLGEHLTILFGRGQLTLDQDDQLLQTFFRTAHPTVRMHAFDFTGHALKGDGERGISIPDEVIQRFMALWDFYWEYYEDDANQFPNVASFGSLFASGQFPAKWALDCLEEFLATSGVPEPLFSVTKQLAIYADTSPPQAVRILDHLIRNTERGWRIHGCDAAAKDVLRLGLKADDTTQKMSKHLIDHLGRMGFPQFGELLE